MTAECPTWCETRCLEFNPFRERPCAATALSKTARMASSQAAATVEGNTWENGRNSLVRGSGVAGNTVRLGSGDGIQALDGSLRRRLRVVSNDGYGLNASNGGSVAITTVAYGGNMIRSERPRKRFMAEPARHRFVTPTRSAHDDSNDTARSGKCVGDWLRLTLVGRLATEYLVRTTAP